MEPAAFPDRQAPIPADQYIKSYLDDFNGDGIPDIAVTHLYSPQMTVYINDGRGALIVSDAAAIPAKLTAANTPAALTFTVVPSAPRKTTIDLRLLTIFS